MEKLGHLLKLVTGVVSSSHPCFHPPENSSSHPLEKSSTSSSRCNPSRTESCDDLVALSSMPRVSTSNFDTSKDSEGCEWSESLDMLGYICFFWRMFTASAIPIDIQTPKLRRCFGTPKTYLKDRTSGGMTGCLGIVAIGRFLWIGKNQQLFKTKGT